MSNIFHAAALEEIAKNSKTYEEDLKKLEQGATAISIKLEPVIEIIYSIFKLAKFNHREIFTCLALLTERFDDEKTLNISPNSAEKNKSLINFKAKYTMEQIAEKTKAYEIKFGDIE